MEGTAPGLVLFFFFFFFYRNLRHHQLLGLPIRGRLSSLNLIFSSSVTSYPTFLIIFLEIEGCTFTLSLMWHHSCLKIDFSPKFSDFISYVQPYMLKNFFSSTHSSPLLPSANKRSSSFSHIYSFHLFLLP